jgi:hypothetical protein
VNEPDLDSIVAGIGAGPVEFPAPGTTGLTQLPSAWRPIAEAARATDRCEAALSLWNPDFLAALPGFARALNDGLIDVRLCRLRGDWTLAYIAATRAGEQITWIGWDPASFGTSRPAFWDTLPGPLRTFLVDVHAGFTAPDGESYGLTRPSGMLTYAAWGGFDGPIPGWDDDGGISSTELMFVTRDSGLLHYCVSPQLPPGSVALVYEGDIDVKPDIARELDELMAERFDLG